MKKLRILPGAAGIIALTATLGFVDGRYEAEAENYSRSRITLVKARSYISATKAERDNRIVDITPDSTAYLVEVRYGEIFSEVLIDATTGRILSSQSQTVVSELHKAQHTALPGIKFPPTRAAA
jgi:hypothetical protein